MGRNKLRTQSSRFSSSCLLGCVEVSVYESYEMDSSSEFQSNWPVRI